jgi:hypothetical protein
MSHADDVRRHALDLADAYPDMASALHRIADHPALKLPPLLPAPTAGDLLTIRGHTWRVLAVDSYPDGLRLTLDHQEDQP